MPRELIARYAEDEYLAEGVFVARREDDLSVEWGKADLPVYADLPGLDAVQVTVKHSVYGEFDPNTVSRELRESRELYSTALTRKQINHLIKTLRKARDQVFGTDE